MGLFQRKNTPIEEESISAIPDYQHIKDSFLDWSKAVDVSNYFQQDKKNVSRHEVHVNCAFYICTIGKESCKFSMFAKAPGEIDAIDSASIKKDSYRFQFTAVIGGYPGSSIPSMCLTPIIKAGTLVVVYGGDNHHKNNRYHLVPTYGSARNYSGTYISVKEADPHCDYYIGITPPMNVSDIFYTPIKRN